MFGHNVLEIYAVTSVTVLKEELESVSALGLIQGLTLGQGRQAYISSR